MNIPNGTATEPRRVSFREGQVLRAADLRDEQDYRRDARRSHHRVGHEAGIVAGLVLQVVAGRVVLGPGMAIDGLGREIFVASSQTLELPENPPLVDIWLAFESHETTRKDVEESDRPSDRFSVRVTRSADAPREDPSLVFLGTANAEGASMSERKYVRGVGREIVGASRQSRILLAPETARDPRHFAVGFPDALGNGHPHDGFQDRLAIHADGSVHLFERTCFLAAGEPRGRWTLGHRSVLVRRSDLRDIRQLWAKLTGPEEPAGSDLEKTLWKKLKEQKNIDLRKPISGRVGLRQKRALVKLFNEFVGSKDQDDIIQRVRFRRPDANRLLQSARSGWERGRDRERLRRLLLEETFPEALAPLPSAFDGPVGVAFADAGPEVKAPQPGRVYRSAIKKDGKTRQELRFEFDDPGKEGDPAAYRLAIGVQGSGRPFSPVLSVDANNTVTIHGRLSVNEEKGSFIEPAPSGDADDPIALSRRLAAVAPMDLQVLVASVQQQAAGVRVEVQAENAGKAAVQAVQIRGVISNAAAPTVGIPFPVTQGTSLLGVRTFPIVLRDFQAAPGQQVHVELLLIGLGPASNVLQANFRGDVTVQGPTA